jgi:hypothetical protein
MTSSTKKEDLPWLVSLQNRTADTGSFHTTEKLKNKKSKKSHPLNIFKKYSIKKNIFTSR